MQKELEHHHNQCHIKHPLCGKRIHSEFTDSVYFKKTYFFEIYAYRMVEKTYAFSNIRTQYHHKN